jgi:hypothetical protein
MSMTDEQIQELEAYLDGELSPEQDAALRIRLKTQDGLANELQSLRAERTLRSSILAQCIEHPGDGEVCDRIVASLRATAASEALRQRWNSRLRYGSALAACLLVGLTTGLLMRSEQQRSPVINPGPVAVGSEPTFPLQGGSQLPPTINVASNALSPVQEVQPRPVTPRRGPVILTVRDDAGTVVARHQFESIDEARRFAEDLKRSKSQQPPESVLAVPVSGQF